LESELKGTAKVGRARQYAPKSTCPHPEMAANQEILRNLESIIIP
jgi:hypothetical protein